MYNDMSGSLESARIKQNPKNISFSIIALIGCYGFAGIFARLKEVGLGKG